MSCDKIAREKCDESECPIDVPANCITVELDCCSEFEGNLNEALQHICDIINKGFTGTVLNPISITTECGLITNVE